MDDRQKDLKRLEKELANFPPPRELDEETLRLRKKVQRQLRKLRQEMALVSDAYTDETLEERRDRLTSELRDLDVKHLSNLPFKYNCVLATSNHSGETLVNKFHSRWGYQPRYFCFLASGRILYLLLGPVEVA